MDEGFVLVFYLCSSSLIIGAVTATCDFAIAFLCWDPGLNVIFFCGWGSEVGRADVYDLIWYAKVLENLFFDAEN